MTILRAIASQSPLNKYVKDEPVSEELLYLATFDYYLEFIVKTILQNFEDEIPNEIKTAISNRLEEINKYIPKK